MYDIDHYFMAEHFVDRGGIITARYGDESATLCEMTGEKQLPYVITFDEAMHRYGKLKYSSYILRRSSLAFSTSFLILSSILFLSNLVSIHP